MASRSRSRAVARGKGASARAPPPRTRAAGSEPGPAPLDLSRNGLLRACVAHPDRTAAAFFALLVLAYLWSVLIGGKILSPIAMLYELPPWQHYKPSDVGNYSNGLLSDIALADYPWRSFARGLIREGTFPAWNPHAFAGIPFFSNPQTGIFSPFSLPLWILPLNYGIGLAAALKLWVGGFGTYLLVRQLRLGFLPGLLAGTSYMFCSLNIVWLTHETLPAVAVMLPWMVWLVERIFERGRLGSALWLAVASAFALGGGHPGMQLHVMAAAALYALLRAEMLRREPGGGARLLRPLALAGGGLALGALLMAVMFVPELLSSHDTLGTLARQGGRGTIPGSQMPFSASRTPLFPDWWGRPSGLEASSRPLTSISETAAIEVNYNERTFYAGVVALLLAAVGLAGRDRWRRKLPFAVLCLLGIAIPLHAPGIYWLVEQLPGFKLVQNQRLHFVFELALAVLAAFGLQALLERPAGDRRQRLGVMIGAAVVGLGAFIAAGPSGTALGHLVHHFLTGKDFQSDAVLALTSVSWYLLFAAGVVAALLAARRWPRRGYAVAAAIVLLAVFDMLHFAHDYQPMGPASKVIPPTTPAITYVQRHVGEGRFVGLEYTLPQAWSLTYGLNDIRGYDPPQPTLRLYHLWKQANAGQEDWTPFTIGALDPAAVRVISVLGARYIMGQPGLRKQPEADPGLNALRRVDAGRDATVFLNERAVPRAIVAPSVQLTAGEDETLGALVAEGFDPRREVVVERDQPGAAALAGPRGAGRGTVVVAGPHENARVVLRASMRGRGLVVLNDALTAGWTVRVDGHPAPALHVNDVMRGVVVGAGRHEVVWSYAVPGLAVGSVLSGLALVVLLGVGGWLVVGRGRTRRGGRGEAEA